MPFPFMDWRFNEFPNESAHALYVTSVEVMALPVADPVQVSNFIDRFSLRRQRNGKIRLSAVLWPVL